MTPEGHGFYMLCPERTRFEYQKEAPRSSWVQWLRDTARYLCWLMVSSGIIIYIESIFYNCNPSNYDHNHNPRCWCYPSHLRDYFFIISTRIPLQKTHQDSSALLRWWWFSPVPSTLHCGARETWWCGPRPSAELERCHGRKKTPWRKCSRCSPYLHQCPI